jgi:hypothetical protein
LGGFSLKSVTSGGAFFVMFCSVMTINFVHRMVCGTIW